MSEVVCSEKPWIQANTANPPRNEARVLSRGHAAFGFATTCAQALRHRPEQDAMIAKLIKIATCDRLRNISPGETLASSLARAV